MKISRQHLDEYEQRYRANLINSLSGFKSANLVGTCNSEGATNLAIVSSVVHVGANPPLVGMIMRPNSVPRHTLENIKATGFYTINQVSDKLWQAAHQTSARYPREVSEFDAVGLTVENLADFTAPYVAEATLKYGLALREVIKLDLNDTEFVLGEITEIHLPAEHIAADGYVDIEAMKAVAVSGLDSYHITKRLDRLPYAKTE